MSERLPPFRAAWFLLALAVMLLLAVNGLLGSPNIPPEPPTNLVVE